MPGTFPTTPRPISIEITSFFPTQSSVAHNLTRQVRTRNVQRFAFRLVYPRGLPVDEVRELWGFLVAQGGRAGTFAYALPTHANRGPGGGTPAVVGAVGALSSTVTSDGWTASTTVLRRGDLVQFSGHAKVYVLTANATSDGSGAATLSIIPPLMAALADNAVISLHTAAAPLSWTCALNSDEVRIDVNHCEKYGLEIELIEDPS